MPASGKKAKAVKEQAVKVTTVKKNASVKVKAVHEKGQEKTAKVGKTKASKAKSAKEQVARPAAKKAKVVKEKVDTSRSSSKTPPKATKTSSKSVKVSPKNPKGAKTSSTKTLPKATKTIATKTFKTNTAQSSSKKTPPKSSKKTPPKAGKPRVKKTAPNEKAVPKAPEAENSPQAKAAHRVIRRIADEPRPSDPLHVSDAVPYICHFAWMFKGVLKCGDVAPSRLEAALASPCDSALFSELLAKLLLTRKGSRARLPTGATCFPYDLLHKLLVLRVTAMHTDVIEDGKGGEGRGRKRKRREGDVKEDEEGGEELEESEEDEGDEGEEEEEEEEKEELEESEEEEEEEEEDDEDPFELEPRGKGLMEELFAPFEGRNPLAAAPFHALSLLERAQLLKLLCEYRGSSDEFQAWLRSDVLNEDQRVAPVCVDGSESRYYHFDHEEGRPFVYVQEYRPRQVKGDPERGEFFLACRDTLSLAKVVGLLRKGNRRDQQAAAVLTDLLAVYKDAETRQVTKDKAAAKEERRLEAPGKRSSRLQVLEEERVKEESWHAQSDRQGRLTELHASATRYVEHATRYLAEVGGAKEDAVVA